VEDETAPFQVMPLDDVGAVQREDTKSTPSCRVIMEDGSSLCKSKGVKREREVEDDGVIKRYTDCSVPSVS
jgi:hypothetical protein